MSAYTSFEKRFIDEMRAFSGKIDMDFVMKEVEKLTKLEYPQTFAARANAAAYVRDLLLKEGFDGVEKIDFAADGKTTYQDKRMPISWDVSHAKLTVLSKISDLEKPVIADYERHPFSIVWGSVSTAPDGIRARIIPESEVYRGEDVRGALILLESNTQPRECLSTILDLGAIGFVCDRVVGALDTPDEITWINNAVDDSGHWHVQSEDRDFIGFSISARDGRALRAAASRGQVWALVESDAHRHTDGKVSLVTATVPGESKREFWMIAHLFEPIATDNSCGVIGAIAIANLIRRLIAEGKIAKPKYTLRLIFSMELYGLSAAADYFGGYLGDRCIGALNIDGMPITYSDDKVMTFISPYSAPFCFNYLAVKTMKMYAEAFPGTMEYTRIGDFTYGDDRPLTDSTVMLPTVWTHHDRTGKNSFHHNSVGRVDFIDPERYRGFLAADAFFTVKCIASTEEDIKDISELSLIEAKEIIAGIYEKAKNEADAASRMAYHLESQRKHLLDFDKYMTKEEAKALADRLESPEAFEDREVPLTPWQKYAKGIVAKRLTVGLPHDLINFPKKDRKALPGLALYSPFANVLANLDSKTDLYEIIRRALWETGTPPSDAIYRKYVNTVHYLAEGGYLEVKDENELSGADVEAALRRAGIKSGDTVLLHSSVSACGHVVGGAQTIIRSFLNVIGEEGTLLAPAFTRPYMYFEGAYQRARNFRPFHPENIDGISTGTIPKVMLRDFGAKRSAHATHSWCALGKNAEKCVSEHKLLDAPCGDNNPMVKAMELGGKVVFFGCGVSSTTFLHYLEDRANSNFLENAVIKIVREDGKLVTELMRNHLPGCRDFYYYKTPDSKFYRRAIERGLKIKRELLGVGDIYAMSVRELYEIGTELFREDPDVTLCDNPACTFCARYRHKKI